MKVLCTVCHQPFEAKGQVTLSNPPICPGCRQAKPLEVAIHEQVSFDDRETEDQKLKEREVQGVILKRRVMDPRLLDEISEALAFNLPTDTLDGMGQRVLYRFVPQYIFNYYPKGLRERIHGPHSRALVGVTRFYPRCQPPVVIDFEPPYPDPWFREQKLQFFLEQGIAYVPITLTDTLSTEAFTERVEAARRMAAAGRQESMDLQAMAGVGVPDVEAWLQTPDVVASIDTETVEVLRRETEASGRPLFGVARSARLATIKSRIIKQLREDMRRGRVVDPLDRHREPASAAQ